MLVKKKKKKGKCVSGLVPGGCNALLSARSSSTYFCEMEHRPRVRATKSKRNETHILDTTFLFLLSF